MVDINITLVFQLVNFLVLYWLLDLVLFRPLFRVMDERKSRFESLAEGFTEEKDEIARLEEEYRNKITGVHLETAKIRRTAREEASQEGAALVGKATEEAQKNLNKKIKGLDDDLGKLKAALDSSVGEVKDHLWTNILK